MKKLLSALLILVLMVSCGSTYNHSNIITYECQYVTHTETINDTVYVTLTHMHTVYECPPEKRPLNNDWIIMH